MGVLGVFGVWFGGVGLCFRGGFWVFWLCWGTLLLLFVCFAFLGDVCNCYGLGGSVCGFGVFWGCFRWFWGAEL